MNHQNALSPSSLALLAAASPTISTTATVSSRWRKTVKIVELRNNCLLFFNRAANDDLSNATHAIQIPTTTRTTNVRLLKLRTVMIEGMPFEFTFNDVHRAKEFHMAVLSTIETLTRIDGSCQGHTNASGDEDLSTVAIGGLLHRTGSKATSLSTGSSTEHAINPGNDRLVSVKTVSKSDVFFSLSDLQQVVDERTTLQLMTLSKSPFISRLQYAYQTSDALCFVTEEPELGDIERIANKLPNRRFPEGVAKAVFAEAVLALSDVHERGIVFRDLTPSKLRLTNNGHVKLCDFCVAKRVNFSGVVQSRIRRDVMSSMSSFSLVSDDSEGDGLALDDDGSMSASSSVTGTSGTIDDYSALALSSASDENIDGVAAEFNPPLPPPQSENFNTKSFIGTRGFLPPESFSRKSIECATEGKDNAWMGTASDVWALGVTLYLMVCGRHPFIRHGGAMSIAEVCERIRHKELKCPSGMSPELQKLLEGMLRKHPTDRFTLEDVQRSAWLSGVDWGKVRRAAQNETVNTEIKNLFKDTRLNSIDELMLRMPALNLDEHLDDGEKLVSKNDAETDMEKERKGSFMFPSFSTSNRSSSGDQPAGKGTQGSQKGGSLCCPWMKHRIAGNPMWKKNTGPLSTNVDLLGFEFNHEYMSKSYVGSPEA